jgi:hypothetical protein
LAGGSLCQENGSNISIGIWFRVNVAHQVSTPEFWKRDNPPGLLNVITLDRNAQDHSRYGGQCGRKRQVIGGRP